MKNERIITHFQSYTTAQGCVKDLTPYFAGRISIITPQRGNNTQTSVDQSAGGVDDNSLLFGISELGGISLGAAAYLVPGLSPILVGGPLAGMAMGDATAGYLTGQIGDANTLSANGQNPTAARDDYFVAVDVFNEQEAQLAERTIRHHGGVPERATEQFVASKGDSPKPNDPTTLPPPGEFRDPMEDYAKIVPNPTDYPNKFVPPCDEELPDGWPQPTGQEVRRIPYNDGYTLDPLSPLTMRTWIDPNIGYGNYDLVDPTTFAHDDPNETH